MSLMDFGIYANREPKEHTDFNGEDTIEMTVIKLTSHSDLQALLAVS